MQMKPLEDIKPQIKPPKQCKRNERKKTTNLTKSANPHNHENAGEGRANRKQLKNPTSSKTVKGKMGLLHF